MLNKLYAMLIFNCSWGYVSFKILKWITQIISYSFIINCNNKLLRYSILQSSIRATIFVYYRIWIFKNWSEISFLITKNLKINAYELIILRLIPLRLLNNNSILFPDRLIIICILIKWRLLVISKWIISDVKLFWNNFKLYFVLSYTLRKHINCISSNKLII